VRQGSKQQRATRAESSSVPQGQKAAGCQKGRQAFTCVAARSTEFTPSSLSKTDSASCSMATTSASISASVTPDRMMICKRHKHGYWGVQLAHKFRLGKWFHLLFIQQNRVGILDTAVMAMVLGLSSGDKAGTVGRLA